MTFKLEDFNTFDDVKHLPLKHYNRTVMFHNIKEDFGKYAAEEYAQQFNDTDLTAMALVLMAIMQNGKEAVHKIVTKGYTPEEAV